MPFRLTVSAMEVHASTQFPELTIAPMGGRALMLQIRTMKKRSECPGINCHPGENTGISSNKFYTPGVILVLRYDTKSRSQLARDTPRPPKANTSNVTPISIPKTRLHAVHSGVSLRRPRRTQSVITTPPAASTTIFNLIIGGVYTLPFSRPSKRCRQPDDVGGVQENECSLAGLLLYRQTKRRLV